MFENIKISTLNKAFAGCLVGSLMLTSCSLDIPLEDQYSDPEAISTVDNARSLLTSAYLGYPHQELNFSILGPDFCPTSLTGKDTDFKNLYNWQDNTISNLSSALWLDMYNVIAICDVLQERLHYVAVKDADEQDDLDNVRSESLALEAMTYFNLLRVFAPAYDRNPEADGVILKNRVGVEFPERSSLKECVEYIRTLLQEALKADNRPSTNGWLSTLAIKYLCAEVELYAGNYADAAKYAEDVLRNCDPSYFTADAYARIWAESPCNERIFGFSVNGPQYVSLQYDKVDGDYFALPSSVTFAEGDYRKAYTVYPFTMAKESRSLLGKYNMLNKEGKKTKYINQMRYAGAYFIAAEAYNEMGQTDKALSLVNEYLGYCGADLLPATLTGDALGDAIVNAKFIEFVGEGVAYFDCKRRHNAPLLRWNRWGTMAVSKIAADDYRWTFPIPRSEYKYNLNVTQNEGWPMNR